MPSVVAARGGRRHRTGDATRSILNAKGAGLVGAMSLMTALLVAPLSQRQAAAQQAPAPPTNGMRAVDLRAHAITNAIVIQSPGKKLEKATIIIRDGAIEAVGPSADVNVPADAQTWNGEGLTVYAGLIEPAMLTAPTTATTSNGAHWNAKIRPETQMSLQPPPDRATRRDLRNMGFTTAAVYPDSGELRGSGTVIALADEDNQVRTYRERAAMMASFDSGFSFRGPPTTPGTPTPGTPPGQTPNQPPNQTPNIERPTGGGGGGYPSSLMGAIALFRQTLLDAQWRRQCLAVWNEHPQGNEPPPPADALDALQDLVARKQPLLFDCSDESNALRADKLAKEFNLDLWMLGNGLEFRKLDEIVATGRPILVPLDFPTRPTVNTMSQADGQSLQDLMTWEQAPTNARRLAKAGATIALTTHRLRTKTDFPANLRTAIKHGLSEDEALAALTTTPAKLLGIDHMLGTIEAGKVANLVVVKGKLFDKDAKVRDVWVNGRRSEVSKDPRLEVKGKGTLNLQKEGTPEVTVEIDTSRPSVTFVSPGQPPKRTGAKSPALSGDLLSWTIDGSALAMPGGYIRFGGAIEKSEKGWTLTGNAVMADGSIKPFVIEIAPGEVGPAEEGSGGTGRGNREDAGGGAGGIRAVAAPRDPISGDWAVALDEVPDMTIGMALKLATDNSVSGTMEIMGQPMPINGGRWDAGSNTLTLSTPTPTGQDATIEAKVSGGQFSGTASGPQGEFHVTGNKVGAEAPAVPEPARPESDQPPPAAQQDPNAPADQQAPGQGQGRRRGQRGQGGPGGRFGGPGGGGPGGTGGGAEEAPFEMPPEQLNHPFGEYGMIEPHKTQNVLLTNATIWTSGPDGIIEHGWMEVIDGKINAIGSGAIGVGGHYDLTIDCRGKHITPGLIDCHSHTGIDGGVNEGTQANTAECRIGDCIDPDDINWYRQLAGGLTAANQLHGSANPIGGQNSVVKLKWGHPASEFPIKDAIPGIKFALGENVKRSTNRYPNTRMGVETFDRDAFTAARDYKGMWERYNALAPIQKSHSMPPRRDLELDTLVEILDGKRIVHCHSYRQDEILMLIRVADDFGFKVGTFQHVLEGYKVAEAIAKHGAGASTFSDWWAYKMEVVDAIPYNGSLMNSVGCVVSFNSDSDELARRLNWEASKAVRYGGLPPAEALKFVTINPAKQLRIDHRTGSLEKGKDADFVIWSGDPLSTYSKCEQTWIEGAKYFDIAEDATMRIEVDKERQRLIQKILRQASGEPTKPGAPQGESATKPESQPASRPGTLLARMLQQHQEWVDEQIRLGRDPDEVLPGQCGCDSIDMIYNNFGGEQ